MLENIVKLCSLFLLFSCTKIKKNDKISVLDTIKKVRLETKEDTILEKNNPEFLDLSIHQIFIDTTRSSKFYKNIIDWKESKIDKELINLTVKELKKHKKYVIDYADNFPNHFITLRKLNNEFVLYDRCDGIDSRFTINNGLFIFYGPLESHAELITNIKVISKNKIKLLLKTDKGLSYDEKSIIEIEKKSNFLYVMKYKNESYDEIIHLTSVEYIKNFDLIVNHCPEMKMPEIVNRFDDFQETEVIEVE
ncbi:hypothetical protein [uncultured Tenacibaculum sp.]|uniref:hypothetical protein n=1 Tax=uncultured Tenacibaculum sp. TaxID=174713 RepID=UPI00261FB043|nr:hypothetical protein [uncultured Tenacibaculum sp.]